ncbi:hypothetical protein GW17_00044695 [Ensete ventricosum]|nr:hypothetical protein GW17_00044695 [Ensete ventricosum]
MVNVHSRPSSSVSRGVFVYLVCRLPLLVGSRLDQSNNLIILASDPNKIGWLLSVIGARYFHIIWELMIWSPTLVAVFVVDELVHPLAFYIKCMARGSTEARPKCCPQPSTSSVTLRSNTECTGRGSTKAQPRWIPRPFTLSARPGGMRRLDL